MALLTLKLYLTISIYVAICSWLPLCTLHLCTAPTQHYLDIFFYILSIICFIKKNNRFSPPKRNYNRKTLLFLLMFNTDISTNNKVQGLHGLFSCCL